MPVLMKFAAILALVAMPFATMSAQAQLVNGDFESPGVSQGVAGGAGGAAACSPIAVDILPWLTTGNGGAIDYQGNRMSLG